MTPLQMFHRTFYVLLYRFEKLCGCDVLTPHWTPHKYTYFWLAINVSFSAFSLTTIATRDPVTRWKCLAWLGLSFQGFIKFHSILVYPRQMHAMVAFLHALHTANVDAATANYRTLQRSAAVALRVMQCGSFGVCAVCAAFMPLTLVANWWTGEREFALQAFVPGIDERTPIGYAVTLVFHALVLCLAATGTSTADMRLVVFVLHLRPMATMFGNLMDELNGALVEGAAQRDSREVRGSVRNLIAVHRQFCAFLKLIGKIYKALIFVEIYTDAITLCFIQFCVLLVSGLRAFFLFDLDRF